MNFSQNIVKDIKICEENILHFPSDNKFAAGITRCLKRIQDILKSPPEDASQFRHDVKNPLGAALGYVELMKIKTKDEREKTYLGNIHLSLNNILKEINVI